MQSRAALARPFEGRRVHRQPVVGRDQAMKNGFLSMVPGKRAATAEEIAEAIVWVGAGRSPCMTGAIVVVDGGYTAG